MAQSDNKLRIPETLRKVKNIVGIFSAKGGVGKSAISLQIALALRDKGFSVGLVDADIYGPSQPIMLGSSAGELKLSKAKVIEPLTKEGIKFISMGLISGENMPVIWREIADLPTPPLAEKIPTIFLTFLRVSGILNFLSDCAIFC